MALSQSDLDAIDQAIAAGELEVESNGRRVRYRSIADLMAARAHIASVLANASTSTSTRPRAAYAVDFATRRGF